MGSLSCGLVVLVSVGLLQAAVLPRTTILLLLFLTAFAWLAGVLALLLAVRLRWLLWDLGRSFPLRHAVTAFTIVLIYTVAQVNVVSWNSVSQCSTVLHSVLQYYTMVHYILICSTVINSFPQVSLNVS